MDVRTDLFSLGLVLYEMASGKRAFAGETAAVVHEAILNQTAVPLHHLNPAVLPRLERVVNKALEKDRNLRYQSASEMGADLSSIKSELSARTNTQSVGTRKVRRVVTDRRRSAGESPSWAPLPLGTFQPSSPAASGGDEADANHGKFSRQSCTRRLHLPGRKDTWDTRMPWVCTLSSWKPGACRTSVDRKYSTVRKWTRVCSRCLAGKFIVNLYVFGKGDSLWTVPITGGKLQELRADAAVPSVSPDGSTIAFMKDQGEAGYREMWLMDANGEHERKLFEAGENSTFQYPKWSPDGRKLIYREEVRGAGPIQTVIESRDLHGGAPTVLVADPRLWTFVPLPGRLVYSLFEQSVNGLSCDLREVPVDSSTGLPKGKPRQLTNWGGVCTGNPTASADG